MVESSDSSSTCLHDSCETCFRQRPKVCPAERELESKADDRRDLFLVRELGGDYCQDGGDRPVAALSTLSARVPTRVHFK